MFSGTNLSSSSQTMMLSMEGLCSQKTLQVRVHIIPRQLKTSIHETSHAWLVPAKSGVVRWTVLQLEKMQTIITL